MQISLTGRFTAAVLACMLPLGALAQQDTAPVEKPAPKPVSQQQSNAAEAAYLQGAKHFKDANYEQAEKSFLKAVRLNPDHREYLMALSLVQEHRITALVQKAAQERQQKHPEKADALLEQARALDPHNPLLEQRNAQPVAAPMATPVAQISAAQRFAGVVQLQPLATKKSFHLRAQTRSILQQVASQYNIKLQIESDIPSKDLRLDLDDVDYTTVMQILCRMAKVMIAPLDEHSALVASDTQPNRDRLNRLEQETIALPGLSTEELNDIGNVIRNIFEIKQTTVQPLAGTIVVRGLPETLVAVNRTLADLIDGGSEVMLRLQLYSVNQSNSRNIGLTLPQQIGVLSAASVAQQIVNENQSAIAQLIASGAIPQGTSPILIALYLIKSGLASNSAISGALAIFGGGVSTALISAGTFPTLNLALSTSDSRELDDIQLRVGDRQLANFRVGSRYPITTSTYSSGLSGAASNLTVNGVNIQSLLGGANSVTIPQIQYEDLGLTVKATPRVERSGDIALHLEMKIESLTGGALNNIPILTSRFFTSDMIIHGGDTAVFLSDVDQQESLAINGSPGLSELPGFQALEGRNTQKSNSSLVLLVTPTLVKRGRMNMAGPYIPFQIHVSE